MDRGLGNISIEIQMKQSVFPLVVFQKRHRRTFLPLNVGHLEPIKDDIFPPELLFKLCLKHYGQKSHVHVHM